MNEVWRDVVGFEGDYKISNLGRVKSLKRIVMRSTGIAMTIPERILRPGPQASGHLTVKLGSKSRGGKYGNSHQVHALVMRAFVGPYPDGMEILHGDHDPGNNRRKNLCYGTRSDNLKADYERGIRRSSPWYRRGDDHNRTIYSDAFVKRVLSARKYHVPAVLTKYAFNLPRGTIPSFNIRKSING